MLLVLRKGRLLGADVWGGVCLGHCTFDPLRRNYDISVRLHIPPGGVLVVDDAPRGEGDTIVIGAEIDGSNGDGSVLVEVCGQPVRIELQFRGAAPG